MYIPIFIAILMGLLSPANQSAHKKTGTVYVKFDGPISQNSTASTDSIPPGEGGDDGGETGIGGPGGTGTSGGTGQNPPPPPPKP